MTGTHGTGKSTFGRPQTGPKPITARHSGGWVGVPKGAIDFGGGIVAHFFTRPVADGALHAFVAREPDAAGLAWHLSISFRDAADQMTRYPSWDEQVEAIRALLPVDLTYVQIVPPDDEYVALHPTTFHWHELTEGTWRTT